MKKGDVVIVDRGRAKIQNKDFRELILAGVKWRIISPVFADASFVWLIHESNGKRYAMTTNKEFVTPARTCSMEIE